MANNVEMPGYAQVMEDSGRFGPKDSSLAVAHFSAKYEVGIACYRQGITGLDSQALEAVKFAEVLLDRSSQKQGPMGPDPNNRNEKFGSMYKTFKEFSDSCTLAIEEQKHSRIG